MANRTSILPKESYGFQVFATIVGQHYALPIQRVTVSKEAYMGQFLVVILVLLAIAGIIFYGWAKAVLLTLLIGGGLFVVAACVCGIYEAATKKKRTAIAAMKGAQEDAVAVLKAIPKQDIVISDDKELLGMSRSLARVSAQSDDAEVEQVDAEVSAMGPDAELKHLRKMAGLE
jgi:hypothetical protein